MNRMLTPWTRSNRRKRSVVNSLLAGLWVGVIISAGCANDSQSLTDDHGVPDEVVVPAVTVIEQTAEVPPDEQAAAERMLASALEDGAMTAEEFEAFALETIECTRRAGFDSRLDYFNAEYRTFSLIAPTVDQTGTADPGEDPAEVAQNMCISVYFDPAYDAFDRLNPRSEEELQLQEQQREQAVFDCLGRSGFEFETIDDFIMSGDVPSEVRVACTQAYNE